VVLMRVPSCNPRFVPEMRKQRSRRGAAALVVPEVFLSGCNGDRIRGAAQPRGADWHRALASLRRNAECALAAGHAERDGASLYSRAVALGVEIVLVPTANVAPSTHVVEATVPAMAANRSLSIT
jgi:hypothetical protein